MPLESGDFIPELNANNPLGGDPKSEGDDHLRLVKRCTLGSFPAFVGNAGAPKSVTLTEDQINDAAQKSAAQTISGAWRFDSNVLLGNSISMFGRNVADDTSFNVAKVNASNQVEIGQAAGPLGSTQYLVPGGLSHQFFSGVDEVARFSSLAIGSILVTDLGGLFKKCGFRNPTTNQQNDPYTLQQSDESRIVRNSSGAANTYTVPQLESFTTIIVINDDTNSTVTLEAGSGVTMTALVGGTRVSAPITVDQDSVVQIYWVNATLVLVWGNGIS